MVNKLSLPIWLSLLALFACLAPVESARALTAEQYLSDGNRLFRDDLYWAALLRYRQAAEEGMDTPMLHYNMGVAHYRAGQHIRARDSLLRALNDPALRVTTQYNLGLNAYELGDHEEALSWFRLVRDQNQNELIKAYAVVAISRIRDEQAKPDDFEVRVAEREEEEREFTDLELRVRLGYGNDDNVFRSPDQPYIDRSDPNRPIVIPVVQSGAFVPLSISAKYNINSLPFEGFYVAYRLGGRYYVDEEIENANEYQHEASFGSEYRREESERKREVYSAFKVAQHDETYYDPDNGGIRDVGGVEIEDRMDYLRYGPELTLRQSHRRLSIGAKIKGQLWNYEKQLVVPEYDHEYLFLSMYGQYRFTETSLFRIAAEGYSRRFSDRPAHDLDGQQVQGNPNIRYDYYALELTARQRIFDSLWFGLNIRRTERLDKYVGYNDYTRDSVSAEVHWSPGRRFDIEASGVYHLYDYPNAFAFHDSTAARKTQEGAQTSIIGTFNMTRHWSIVAEARYRETVSNDTRIQYERNQYSIGVRWEQ
jgi:tetratricopeptide (TPR) repeat protein